MRRILVATRSSHKLGELRQLLHLPGVELVDLDDLGIPGDPVEDGATFADNALIKARWGTERSGLPTLADDSGIEVDALGGRPGVRSARYAGEGATDEQNLREMIRAIRGIPGGGRTARYRCLAVLSSPEGALTWAEGTCEGTLEISPRGSGGFGYDPIFVPAGWDETMAELTAEQKDRISHRGRAFRALRDRLAQA